MTNEAKKFTVTILGQSYTIVSDEDEERVLQAAALVDASMQGIIQKANGLDPEKVAVLVALKYASKLLAQESIMQNISKRELELISIINREMQACL